MRPITFLGLLAITAALPRSQAAPVPKRTNAKPAVIDAGTEKNIEGAIWYLVNWARVAVRENEKVANLDIVRRQKDWEAWLKKNLCAERVKGKNLIHVSFQDGNAKEQAAIINVVVDYYLKNEVGRTRDSEKKRLETLRSRFAARHRAGRITAEQAAKAEESFKEREESIRTLPALVEHAKTP